MNVSVVVFEDNLKCLWMLFPKMAGVGHHTYTLGQVNSSSSSALVLFAVNIWLNDCAQGTVLCMVKF